MLREVAQSILNVSGWITELFISPDSYNFSFIEMAVALLLLIFFALFCMWVPQLFADRAPKNKH